MAKPFASSADLSEVDEHLHVLCDGVYALTAGGDPTVGAIEADDFLICFEARATPVMANRWLEQLRKHTQKPVRFLVLSHYHAVRTLGAAAFDAEVIVAHRNTATLIDERGMQDWASEHGRMPRLFQGHETIPGLTRPTVTFESSMRIGLGPTRGALELQWLGRGHTDGDIVAWLPTQKVVFAGDLVESEAALYTGDAWHLDWMTGTLDAVQALGATTLVGGRGSVANGSDGVNCAIEQTRGFLTVMHGAVVETRAAGGTLKDAFTRAHALLEPEYGKWPIFEHCLPFDVSRLWDELDDPHARPQIWTAERDRAVWAQLQD